MTLDTDPVTCLIGETNRRLAANLQPGSNAYSGWLAGIRAGITPAGEVRAMSQAAPFVAQLQSSRARSSALRAAAIRAINKDVSQSRRQGADDFLPRLGASLALLARKDNSTSIEEQLAALPLMNVDAAALVLDGLIGRCARHHVSVDFYDLTRTLVFWGSGEGSRATERRNRIVMDFYRGPASATSN